MSVDVESVAISVLRSVWNRLQRVRQTANIQSLTLFSPRDIVHIGWVGLATLITLNVLFRLIIRQFLDHRVDPHVLPRAWPISVFKVRLFTLPTERWLLLLSASILVFILLIAYVLSDRNAIVPVLGASSVLVVLTNLLQGKFWGLVAPLWTKGAYYRAAVRITDPLAFIQTYDEQQFTLPLHASTHPPGSVLTPYLFEQLLGLPARVTAASTRHVAVAIAVVSLVVSGYLLYRLLRTYFEPDLAQYVTLLFVLLPAVQIYSLASLDAIILVLFLGTVYCFTRESHVIAGIGTFCCLALAAWHTFMFVFLLPVLGGFALYRRDRLWIFVFQLVGLVVCYFAGDLLLGYDYIGSFFLASKQQTVAATLQFTPTAQQVRTATLENTSGFLLLAEPAKYIFTRIEDIAEIALFFTPYLCVICVRGISALRARREAFVLSMCGILSLLGMFAAGVYHTGETARGAMYIYPFLLLPVAAVLDTVEPTRRDKWMLAALVFAQTLLMQVIGFYRW